MAARHGETDRQVLKVAGEDSIRSRGRESGETVEWGYEKGWQVVEEGPAWEAESVSIRWQLTALDVMVGGKRA